MEDHLSRCTITIILATTIPSTIVLVLLALLAWRLLRRKARFFQRGITPIDDEEIESWKTGRPAEKDMCPELAARLWHGSDDATEPATPSTARVRKSSSVIVYQCPSQHGARVSMCYDPSSSAPYYRPSIDMPPTPVLARAPNARPGLTDETVQGADAFVSLPKRPPCHLSKPPPPCRLSRHGRSKSSRSTMSASTTNLWYDQHFESQHLPRRSVDLILPLSTTYKSDYDDLLLSLSTPVQSSLAEGFCLGGFISRPLIHKSDIGRAIG